MLFAAAQEHSTREGRVEPGRARPADKDLYLSIQSPIVATALRFDRDARLLPIKLQLPLAKSRTLLW